MYAYGDAAMTRQNMFLAHLAVSLLAVALVLTLVLGLWYPYPYFQISGDKDQLQILIAAFLIVGPVMTLILFKPGKAGLWFDMLVVPAMQVGVLVYGLHSLYQERPLYTVFVKDRFEVLTLARLEAVGISRSTLPTKPMQGPLYIVATLPTDNEEQQRVLFETLLEGKPDIHLRPEYWGAYAKESAQVKKATESLGGLLERRPDRSDDILQLINAREEGADTVFVPVMGKKRIYTLILNPQTLLAEDVLGIDPWVKPAKNE
jgi:hypothetical protein